MSSQNILSSFLEQVLFAEHLNNKREYAVFIFLLHKVDLDITHLKGTNSTPFLAYMVGVSAGRTQK